VAIGHRPAAAIGAILLVLAVAAPATASAGDLDPNFGVAGTTVVSPERFNAELLVHMAVQADGKIVVVGSLEPLTLEGPEGFLIVRLTTDGGLDASFGVGGVVVVEDVGRSFNVVIDDQDRILIVGLIIAADGSRRVSLVRLLPDGSLDLSFGSGGRVITPPTGVITWALALQPDGKIVVAGQAQWSGFGTRAILRRYEADGSVDRTFGRRGRVTIPHVWGGFSDLAIEPDGRLVAAGVSMDSHLFIARFDADGSLDPTFAGDGKRITRVGSENGAPTIVGLTPGGSVVVAVAVEGASRFGLVRYTPAGQRDRSFRGGGTAILDSPGILPFGATFQADGKIVITSFDITPISHAGKFALHRFLSSGRPDPSFGKSGRVLTDFEGTDDLSECLAVQADGALLIGGATFMSDESSGLRVARYLAA
jgi:uncharacterized delta-60 repeat protein